jgi:hypothetical protein
LNDWGIDDFTDLIASYEQIVSIIEHSVIALVDQIEILAEQAQQRCDRKVAR